MLSAIFNLGDKILSLGNCNRALRYFTNQFVLEFKEKALHTLGQAKEVCHVMREESCNHTNE